MPPARQRAPLLYVVFTLEMLKKQIHFKAGVQNAMFASTIIIYCLIMTSYWKSRLDWFRSKYQDTRLLISPLNSPYWAKTS